MSSPSPVKRRTGGGGKSTEDWEEAYLQMQQRYLQAQKELQRRDHEEKMKKVQAAKASKNAGQQPPSSLADSMSMSRQTSLRLGDVNTASSPAKQQRPASAGGPRKRADSRPGSAASRHNPSASMSRQASAAVASGDGAAEADEQVAAPPHGHTMFSTLAGAGVPPDPSMVWGVDETLMGMVKSNALIQVNEKLREKLLECEDVIRGLQSEVERGRKANERISSQVHTLTMERDHLLMERETVVTKAASHEAAVASAHAQLRDVTSQHDSNRATLEAQLREQRSKLALAYDRNDELATESRRLTAELREKSNLAARLETHLVNVTSTGSTQKEVNQSLVLELQNMNEQLATERRRVLELTRDAQISAEQKRQIGELQVLLDAARNEKRAVDEENLRLLADAAKSHELAAEAARIALRDELDDAKERANHWENVCRLQFRDIQLRTKQHMEAKDTADKIKGARDAAEVHLAKLRAEVAALEAKLDVVWPSHQRDSAGLTAEEIRASFIPKTRRGTDNGRPAEQHHDDDGRPSRPQPVAAVLSAKVIEAELGDTTSPDVIIAELRQANDQLIAEVDSLRAANQLLSSHLGDATAAAAEQRRDVATAAKRVEDRERARLRTLEKYDEQIDFLEAQVRALRGTAADDTSFSVADLDLDNETVLVLSLGQLLLDARITSDAAKAFWSDFPMVFVTVDFLLHESAPSEVVATSTNAFLDMTLSYRVRQDALLLHNLACRPVRLELHQVTGPDTFKTVGRATVSAKQLVHSSCNNSERPGIRLHANFKALDHDGNMKEDILARLEVTLTARTCFTASFVKLCDAHEAAETSNADHSVTVDSSVDVQRSFGLFSSVENPSKPLTSVTNVVQVLSKVTHLAINFVEVKLDYSLPQSPLLTFYYALPNGDELSDVWVLPPSPVAKYEYAYNYTARHPVAAGEGALAAVRSPLPVVAFDSAESDPSVSFGVASLDLSPLLDRPTEGVTSLLPLVASASGSHVGVVHIQAEFVVSPSSSS